MRTSKHASRAEAPRHLPIRHSVFAVAAPGVAPLIAAECEALGLVPTARSAVGVSLSLTTRELFTLACWTRCASRVLLRLHEFTARDFATLEKQAARIDWSRMLAPGSAVSLRVTCRKSRLYHSDAVAERIARGIVGAVPGVRVDAAADDDGEGAASPQLIVVRFDHDQCTISADATGMLHRRGWRQAVAKAPLRETLAASMLAAMGWDGSEPLVDPFCGSGTIGIEAALRARRIAPGLHRSFAMEGWPGAPSAEFADVRALARAMVRPSLSVPIVLSDRDDGAIRATRANAERAGVLADITVERRALSDTELASIGTSGWVLTNPPYGLRVSDGADLRGLFARLGQVMMAGGEGWRLGMLMPNDRRLLASLGGRMQAVFSTENGGIPVQLFTGR